MSIYGYSEYRVLVRFGAAEALVELFSFANRRISNYKIMKVRLSFDRSQRVFMERLWSTALGRTRISRPVVSRLRRICCEMFQV